MVVRVKVAWAEKEEEGVVCGRIPDYAQLEITQPLHSEVYRLAITGFVVCSMVRNFVIQLSYC